eukprot:SAG31_NODE_5774_length_2332_cov_2.833856_3_plen_440_part_00
MTAPAAIGDHSPALMQWPSPAPLQRPLSLPAPLFVTARVEFHLKSDDQSKPSIWPASVSNTNSSVVDVTVDITEVINPGVSRRWMGCHSVSASLRPRSYVLQTHDCAICLATPTLCSAWLGFAHQCLWQDFGYAQTPRGFLANLVYNPSFVNLAACASPCVANSAETQVPDWLSSLRPGGSGGGAAAAKADVQPVQRFAADQAFNTRPTVQLSNTDGRRDISIISRGMAGAGFALQGGREYDFAAWFGVFFGGPTVAFVELFDRDANHLLTRQEFNLSAEAFGGRTWKQFNFPLTPSRSTGCTFIAAKSDPTVDCASWPRAGAFDSHTCQRCGGELRVGLASRGAVNLGYVSLMPGAWGRVRDQRGRALPMLRSAADMMERMGITAIRSGGSASQSMRWKDWRGAVYNRPSGSQIWGRSLLAEWYGHELHCSVLLRKSL